MEKDSNEGDELKHLGSGTPRLPKAYAPDLLEAFSNPHPQKEAWTSLICPEFTSVCPKTGWPDFAKVFINYMAAQRMVESKSLKLYLGSFRHHGAFHEDCIQTICNDLRVLLTPRFIEVRGEFNPRGGIAITSYASWALDEERYQKLCDHRRQNYDPLGSSDLGSMV
ncbi:MAG: preQ(1) synthase [Bacteriovoracales bacterium]|nr:preQ(1) synthase [Bacteriovoracales bacterium]